MKYKPSKNKVWKNFRLIEFAGFPGLSWTCELTLKMYYFYFIFFLQGLFNDLHHDCCRFRRKLQSFHAFCPWPSSQISIKHSTSSSIQWMSHGSYLPKRACVQVWPIAPSSSMSPPATSSRTPHETIKNPRLATTDILLPSFELLLRGSSDPKTKSIPVLVTK